MREIEPYPETWIRILDFLPLLKLQSVLDEDVELFYCKTSVSVPNDISFSIKKKEEGEFGILKQDPINRNRIEYMTKGGTDPREEYEITSQKEIVDEIQNIAACELPEIVINKRGLRTKIAGKFDDIESLDGSQYIFRTENGSGNYQEKYKRMLNFNLINPTLKMKEELLVRGILQPTDLSVFGRIRSALKTDWLITDTKGYYDLYSDLPTIEKRLSVKKWWQDIGEPVSIEGFADHQVIKGQIFFLRKMEGFAIF